MKPDDKGIQSPLTGDARSMVDAALASVDTKALPERRPPCACGAVHEMPVMTLTEKDLAFEAAAKAAGVKLTRKEHVIVRDMKVEHGSHTEEICVFPDPVEAAKFASMSDPERMRHEVPGRYIIKGEPAVACKDCGTAMYVYIAMRLGRTFSMYYQAMVEHIDVEGK